MKPIFFITGWKLLFITKRALPITIFCLLFLQAFAQKSYDLKWGKSLESAKKNEQIQAIVATDGEYFVALRQKRSLVPYGMRFFSNPDDKAALELYDKDLRLLKSAEIELEQSGEELALEKVIVVGGKLYVLTSFFNSKQEKKYLFARPIDSQTLKAKGDFVKLLEIRQLSKLNPASFSLVVSPDSTKLLAAASLALQKGQHEQVVLAAFNSNMSQIWGKTVELPYPENDIWIQHFSMDNACNAYVLASRHRSRQEKESRQDYDFDYYVFSWRNGGSDFREHKAQLNQKHVSAITFRALDNGDIACAGFYSDEGNNRGVKGAFFYKISASDGMQQTIAIKEFDFDLRIADLTERKQEKAVKKKEKGEKEDEAELYNYRLRQLILRPDGSALLVGEQYYTVTKQSYDGKNWRTYTVEHYGNILALQVLPDGQIGWANLVNKHQVGGGYASSYAFAQQKNQLVFVFSQLSGVLGEPDLKIATVSLADGKVEMDFLTRKLREKTDMNFDAYVSEQISDQTLILHLSRGKNYCFGKLTLP